MAKRTAMDVLLEALGDPPFSLSRIDYFRSWARSLAEAIEPGQEVGENVKIDAARMVELLGELLVLIRDDVSKFVREYTKVFPKYLRMQPVHLRVHEGGKERYDQMFKFLPREALQLKKNLLERGASTSLSNPVPGTAALCPSCLWITTRIAKRPHGILQSEQRLKCSHLCEVDSWPDLPLLTQAAQKGCGLCSFLYDTVRSLSVDAQAFNDKPALVWLSFVWSPFNGHENCLISIEVSLQNDLDPGQTKQPGASYQRDFLIDSKDEFILSELSLNRPRRERLLSIANIDLMRQELAYHNTNLESYVPKRLVDLGSGPEPHPVLATPQLPLKAPYATLSYCWGPESDAFKQLKTTPDNLAARSHHIDLEAMSPVMRDAAAVCRALDIRYLWIDALCIIQGDKADWDEQSAQMANIFGSAYLTICTLASSSCMEGFLDDKEPPVLQLGFVSSSDTGICGTISVRPSQLQAKGETSSSSAKSAFLRDLVASAWNTRGWIFQEKCLSPRKLYFGQLLHLQRDDTIKSENNSVQNIASTNWGRQWPKFMSADYLRQQGHHAKNLWYDVIQEVNQLQWTVASDLFPGLSGIASRFNEVIKDKYVAGLWAGDLACGFMWAVTHKSAQSLQELLRMHRDVGNKPVISPSWSWASFRTSFRFLISPSSSLLCRIRTHLRPEFVLLEDRVQLSGSNPFGAIQGAPLRLSGILIAAPDLDDIESDRRFIFPKSTPLVYFDWDWESPGNENISKGDLQSLRMLLVSTCCSDWPDEFVGHGHVDSQHEKDMAFCIAVFTGFIRYQQTQSFIKDNLPEETARANCRFCSDSGRRRDAWGLLLHPTTRPDVYYRVGIFISRAEQAGDHLFQGAHVQTIELI